eukprot:6196936-Pleurochrysis_carterae.AAC.1
MFPRVIVSQRMRQLLSQRFREKRDLKDLHIINSLALAPAVRLPRPYGSSCVRGCAATSFVVPLATQADRAWSDGAGGDADALEGRVARQEPFRPDDRERGRWRLTHF